MEWFFDLISNPYLLTGLGSWFLAQVMKTVIHAIINRRIIWERLVGDGGMPSGHSATVTSLAVLAGLRCGCGSFEFAVSGILAIIVCHDAMGVRLETGKQAVIINELVEALHKISQEKVTEEKLKIFVGHTPIQVTAGILIGVLNAFLMNWLLP